MKAMQLSLFSLMLEEAPAGPQAEQLHDLHDPLIVHPGGWDEDLPAWLREAVIEERVARAVAGDDDLATLAEVLCYLFTASLAAPLSREWAEIYINLAARYMAARGAILPEDVQPRPFTEHEETLLRDLRRDIRRRQKRERQKRRRKQGRARCKRRQTQ